MSDVVLLGAVHDPEGRVAALLPDDLPLLQQHYTRIYAICGVTTPPTTIEALHRSGVTVISGEDIPINARPYALGVMASHTEWEHVHLCDLDSALHWARCWPDELDRVNATVAAYDFLLLGRTARAMATLPEAQRETERLINLLFARTTGGLDGWRLVHEPETLVDLCAGAWGFSRRGVAALHARARITDIGFHAEWPLIARDTPDLRCVYLPCEGLEYETADRYADQIAAAGGIKAWHDRQNADILHWQKRIEYITQIADAIAAYSR
ncbi:MAG: hypothetical protein ACYDAR_12595 [Thermomicrobiales bacterium]